MRERLLASQADLTTLLREANQIVEAYPEQTRKLGWSELEARIHLLETALLLVEAELARTAPAGS
jgi:hypothetical protein